jgi:hypothetical protein
MGSEEQQFQSFVQTAQELSTRIRYLLLVMERRRKEMGLSS